MLQYCFCFMFWLWSMWDLSSPMRDGTHTPCTGSQSLNHWTTGSLCFYFFIQFLGKSCGQRSLVGCSPWGREELDTTERHHFHFSLSCIGEGNGNPLQWSCLENPRDGGAWWAAAYGVIQSRTWLKWLSSSSRSYNMSYVFAFSYCLKTQDSKN